MSLLDHPDAQALLADAVLTPDAVRGCQDRLTAFLARYLPRFYRDRAAGQRHARHPRPAQRPAAQDLRADRRRGRRPPQADPVLRRRRQVGRRGGHGRTPPPRRRGAGRRPSRPGHRPQRPSPSRGPSRAAWPASGAAGWASRTTASSASSWPTPPPAATRRWTGGCTCPRTGPPTPARRAKCHVPEAVDLPGDVADRRRPAGAVPRGPAPRLGHAATTSSAARPSSAPGSAGQQRAVRARRALRHERPRPGVPPAPAAACRPGRQAAGAVLPGRRLGGPAAGRRGGPG